MSRRKPNITDVKGFRTDCQDFFKYQIGCTEHLMHTTPFIFFLNGMVQTVYYTRELLKIANDNDTILKAWVGKWRTDVFAFKVKDLKEYLSQNNVRI